MRDFKLNKVADFLQSWPPCTHISCIPRSLLPLPTASPSKKRQRYQCKGCGVNFDDLTDTIFAGHHQPLRVWVLCLYFMGLNLSNLLSWLRLHRGISQEKLPLYLSFFEFVHNSQKRGKDLLSSLLQNLLA